MISQVERQNSQIRFPERGSENTKHICFLLSKIILMIHSMQIFSIIWYAFSLMCFPS